MVGRLIPTNTSKAQIRNSSLIFHFTKNGFKMKKTFTTTIFTMATSAKKAAKAAKAKPSGKKRAGGGRRPAGEDLATYIANALGASKSPMGISDIAAAVKKAGYNTGSAQFKGIVAMRLSTNKRFKRVERGLYTVAKGGKK